MNRHKPSIYRFLHFLPLLFLLLLKPASVYSQNYYPVHVSVQVLPPYGVYLTDYYSANRDRLIVTLLNRDKQQRPLQVKLRVRIRNGSAFQLFSRDELYYPQITLESGIPLRLTGTDLGAYLSSEKIRLEGRLNEGKLPTGMTEFSVQAVDYATGRVLSEFGTGRAWLEMKQPPTLNLPQKDEQVAYRTPQQIRFQWLPRHQGLAGTEYEFVLKELPDNGADPQGAFSYGQEIYRNRTRFTTLNYTHLEQALTPGKRYGWQIRAIAKDGADEIGMFENNGYSEVGWFTLDDNCPSPVDVKATAGYRKLSLSWNSAPEQRSFMSEYRPKSEHQLYDWTSVRTFDTSLTVYDVTPGWKYEYRIGALCTTDKPVYSPVGEIVLPTEDEERVARCGILPEVDLGNKTVKENLNVGDIVIIGRDFPMTITQISAQGNGWYSGKGWIILSWIFDTKVAVKFNRLRINADNRQIDGEVETETDPKASNIGNTNELDYGGKPTTEAKVVIVTKKLDFTIPAVPEASYNPESGELIIFDTDGEPHVIATQKNEGESIFPMIVEDADGNKYRVEAPPADEQGAAGEEGESGSGLQKPVITPIHDVSSDFDKQSVSSALGSVVTFSKGNGKYAFDAGREPWYENSQLINSYYQTLGNNYIAPWKLIPVGSKDVVTAELSGKGLDMKKVQFVLGDGTALPAREVDGKWELTLPSVGSGETYEVFALYEEKKNKYETLGKLNVVSYPVQEQTVTLVPINGTMPDVSWTERELNRIYNPYGIRFRVKTDNSLKGNMDWDSDKDGLMNLNGSGFFSKETAEMRKLRKLYRDRSSNYDRNSYYIFVLDGSKAGDEPDSSLAVQGDMPRGKQFGYIFMRNTVNTPRLIAHELGHGIFTLRHSFDVNYSGDKFKSATGNLMDYNDGVDLAVWQWNILAHPAPLTWFDSGDDGMSVEDGVSAIAELYMKYVAQYKDGVYMAIHGFKCDGVKTATPQVSINSSDSKVLQFGIYKLRGKGGVSVILFRVSDETIVKPSRPQITLDKLKEEVRREINNESDFLQFYKSEDGLSVPLKKSNDWKQLGKLREEACGINTNEAYAKYGEHILWQLFTLKAKNSILFVNGYMPGNEFLNKGVENNMSFTGNAIEERDASRYWEGIDDMFMRRRSAIRSFYANGHMGIATSNHRTAENFLLSLKSTNPKMDIPALVGLKLPPTPPYLNTRPNVEGFRERLNNGRIAGLRFVEILREEGYAAGDTLDIVAHSMGFAYAQGMIEVIEDAISAKTLYIHLGGYYIIAPENGCSGEVNPGHWDEIWQYGSNEQVDPITKQDGVAPQCKVGNLDVERRAFIPDTEPRGFLESHTIVNYKWIFNRKQNHRGYVTPRK